MTHQKINVQDNKSQFGILIIILVSVLFFLIDYKLF